MFKVIKGKELQELLDKHLICLRCGANKGEGLKGNSYAFPTLDKNFKKE